MQIGVAPYRNSRQVMGLMMALLLLGAVWALATWIVGGSNTTLVMLLLGLVFCSILIFILKDWRSGVLVFLVWLLFEDLARKYLGNSMTIFFAKDVMVGVCYVSYFLARRRRQAEGLKIPFLVPLAIFLGLAAIQTFNPNSPSFLYGLLGLKLYFYYVPLVFLGYAMIERPADLDRFLVINLVIGTLIAALGIAQSVLGTQFLTPDDIAPELYDLTHTVRLSPVTQSVSAVTSSVFVSSGRFSTFLILLWILVMGALGYMLLSRQPGARYGILSIGVATVAVFITGTRTPFVFLVLSVLIMTAGFLWGAPWSWGQGHRLVTAIRRAFLIGAIALFLMAEVFPVALGGRWNYIAETLSFGGQGSQLQDRAWAYPTENFMATFQFSCWFEGCGTGVSSLGTQYVARFLNVPRPEGWVESGFGALILEMGVLGPVLWIIWVAVLLWSGWRVITRLRQTVYFPIGFAIWWYALVLLVLLTYFGLAPYQNFVNNAYLWLLIGILFRLPKLAQMPQPVPARSTPLWQLATGGR